MKISNYQKGMTLVEILLYISILSVIVVTVSAFLNISLQSRVKGQTIGEVEQSSSQAMEIITTNIRGAKSVTSPARTANGAVLNLVMPGVAQTVDFRLNAGKIEMQKNGGGYSPITSNRTTVTNLVFSNLTKSASAGAPANIRVNFRTDHINTSGRNEYEFGDNYQGSASLRSQQ